jgi:transcriptional regulator with XRE-family HTH domain
MTREALVNSKEYQMVKWQMTIYQMIKAYQEKHGLNQSELAAHLGVTKGYISQILNGNFDHKISKVIELSLALGMVPNLGFEPSLEDRAPENALPVNGTEKSLRKTLRIKKNLSEREAFM